MRTDGQRRTNCASAALDLSGLDRSQTQCDTGTARSGGAAGDFHSVGTAANNIDQDQHSTFGELLREQRLAAAMTQAELAERAGISMRAVQDLERGISLPHRDTLARLVASLGIREQDRGAFVGAARAAPRHRKRADPEAPADASPVVAMERHNLPVHLSSFIGRQRELGELRELLSGARLVTLAGTGGVGKTRLAIQLAESAIDQYPSGVWFVDLAAVADGGQVTQTLARVLDLRELPGEPLLTTLEKTLRAQRPLIVLDNCEHLLEGCARLTSHLLRTCRGLAVLATSREPLGIEGEAVWPVPPLSTPPSWTAETTIGDLAQSEAIQLFVTRATAVHPAFSLSTNGTARAVCEICRRLDGLPLGIELVAARVGTLGVEQIARYLEHRLDLFAARDRTAPLRHQTLHATIVWSYDLLNEPEQRMFRRLSVFPGSFSLEAAEAVVDEDHAIDLLLRLVDKSLVVTDQSQGPSSVRYRLLETVRAFAYGQLVATGGVDAIRMAHAHYFSMLAQRLWPDVEGPAVDSRVAEIRLDYHNFRAAAVQLLERGAEEESLALSAVLWRYWDHVGLVDEASDWLEEPLHASQLQTEARANALISAGLRARSCGNLAAAERHGDKAILIARALGNTYILARALNMVAMVQLERGDFERAHLLAAEGNAASRKVGSRYYECLSFRDLARAARGQGKLEDAEELALQAYRVAKVLNQRYTTVTTLSELGEICYESGDQTGARAYFGEAMIVSTSGVDVNRSISAFRIRPRRELSVHIYMLTAYSWLALDTRDLQQASTHLRESLTLSHELGHLNSAVVRALEGCAGLAAAIGRPELALGLFGACLRVRNDYGFGPNPHGRATVDRWLESARASLGEPQASAHVDAGRHMDLQHAVAAALALLDRHSRIAG